MPDDDIRARINQLVDEEHRLRSGEHTDPARLRELEEQLDQCWDLLRQRIARREFGEDPAEATTRSPETVEHYEQ